MCIYSNSAMVVNWGPSNAVGRRFIPPGIDVNTGLVTFGGKSTLVTIPAFESPVTLSPINGEAIITTLQEDENPMDSVFEVTGAHRIGSFMLAVCSLFLSGYVWTQVESLQKHHLKKNTERSRSVRNIRMLILVPELINGIVKFFVAIDPLGGGYIIDLYTARRLLNCSGFLGAFTDVVMVIYCKDPLSAFRSSRTMDESVPSLRRHKHGFKWIVGGWSCGLHC